MIPNCLETFFYHIDIFKTPFQLSFNGRMQSSTCLGSFFSFSILALVIYLFFTSNMLLKINPQVINQIITSDQAPSIKLTHQNFEIAAGIADSFGTGQFDPTIFKIKFFLVELNLFANVDSQKKITKEIPEANPCSEKSFSDPNAFYNLALANFTCLEKFSLNLEGGFDEQSVHSVVVMISYCDNKTDGVICKPQTEIDNFFTDKGLWLYYQDDIYDVSNYENPIKKNWRVQSVQCANVTRSIDLFFKKLIFITDDGLLFSNEHITYGFMKEKIEALSDYIMIDTQKISINLFSSKNIQKTQRQYQKFGELLANIGGLINVLVMVGFFITNVQNQLKMQNHIMNSLYYYSFEKKAKKTRKKMLKRKKSMSDPNLYNWNENYEEGINCPMSINIGNQDFQNRIYEPCKFDLKKPNLEKLDPYSLKLIDIDLKKKIFMSSINKLENLKKISDAPNKRRITLNLKPKILEKRKSNTEEKDLNENRPISLKLFGYFKLQWKLFWRKKLKIEEKLFLLSKKRLLQETDIAHILDKIHQFEKFKMIILNPKQLELFNFLAKPLIVLESQKERISKKSIYMLSENFIMSSNRKIDAKKRKERMNLYYKDLANTLNLSEIDRNILHLIEEDILINK